MKMVTKGEGLRNSLASALEDEAMLYQKQKANGQKSQGSMSVCADPIQQREGGGREENMSSNSVC